MPRIQLELPEKFIFETDLTIRASDINYGGHVGNDRILTLMQEARILFYRSVGFKDELSFEGNVGHLIADAVLLYKAEAFLGDIITVKITASDFNKYGFDMYYQIINKESGKEIARGKTGMVCYDYVRKKVTAVPGVLRDKLGA